MPIELGAEEIVCRDCGKSFVFSVSEQEFYQSKGFHKPLRCRDCRIKKKARFNERKNWRF